MPFYHPRGWARGNAGGRKAAGLSLLASYLRWNYKITGGDMSDINTITLIGRMTKDAELKTTQSGKSVASFSIAVGKTFRQAGEKKEQTSFFNCTAWGTIGEAIAQYCKKGHRIGITGELQQRTWEDQSGERRSAVEIVVRGFQFLQPRKSDDAPPPDGVGNEEIPF